MSFTGGRVMDVTLRQEKPAFEPERWVDTQLAATERRHVARRKSF